MMKKSVLHTKVQTERLQKALISEISKLAVRPELKEEPTKTILLATTNPLIRKVILDGIQDPNKREAVTAALEILKVCKESLNEYNHKFIDQSHKLTDSTEKVKWAKECTTKIKDAISENKSSLIKEPSFISKCMVFLTNVFKGIAFQAVEELKARENKENTFYGPITSFKPKL